MGRGCAYRHGIGADLERKGDLFRTQTGFFLDKSPSVRMLQTIPVFDLDCRLHSL